MRDIFVEKHYLTRRNVRKRHIMAFIILSTLLIIFIISSLSLHNWLRYCWWDFGLVYASSFTTFSNFKHESAISDIQSDACNNLKSLVQYNCPNFCSNLESISGAGSAMLVCSIISILFYTACIVFHFWSFFKVQFKFRRIWIFFVVPCFLYNFGVFLYFFNAKIWDIDKPNTERFDLTKAEMREGSYLALGIVPLSLALASYGLLKTRDEFLDKETEEVKG